LLGVAVGGESNGDGVCDGMSWGWISIASLVMIGTAFIVVAIALVLYTKSDAFHHFVGGFKGITIEQAMYKVTQQSHQP